MRPIAVQPMTSLVCTDINAAVPKKLTTHQVEITKDHPNRYGEEFILWPNQIFITIGEKIKTNIAPAVMIKNITKIEFIYFFILNSETDIFLERALRIIFGNKAAASVTVKLDEVRPSRQNSVSSADNCGTKNVGIFRLGAPTSSEDRPATAMKGKTSRQT